MIIFIKSKVSNGKIRNFIRRTWASVKYTKNGRLVYVFVLGKPTSKTEFNLAEEESKRFEDILMFDGPDNYKFINTSQYFIFTICLNFFLGNFLRKVIKNPSIQTYLI